MTIDTKPLRDLIHRASPTPWLLATSNSWRRIVDSQHAEVCVPCNQPDGHPDLRFVGGYEGANAQLLIEAVNALPALLDIIHAHEQQVNEYAQIAEKTRTEADARTDAQAAEIAQVRGQIEFLHRHNTGLRDQHSRDSKTLREYAQARDDLRKERDRLHAENSALRSALEVARLQIEIDRDGLIITHGVINVLGVRAIPEDDAHGQEGLREYNKTLECINAALAQEQGESDGKG